METRSTVMQVDRCNSAEGVAAADVMQLQCNLLAQLDSVALYEALAALERDGGHKYAYSESAAAGRERAELWAARLRSAGAPVPRIRIPRRVRLIAKLVSYVGGGFAIPIFTRPRPAHSEHRAGDPPVVRRAPPKR